MQTQTEMQKEVDEAVRTMRAGGIILYPTDTVWGLGCDATSAAAVERIYKLKRSVNKKSMLVLCASADMIVRYVNKAPGIAFEVMELATSPLTAILPGASGLAENLIPDEGTLGVRIPDHEFCRRMLRALGRPIVSTSANISGEATPVGLQDVAREIIDGEKAGQALHLTTEELAFYDALTKPEAVRDFYTNDQLLAITHELTDALRKNKTIDWNLKESARAGMRRLVKRLLKKYKYPPEGQEDALNTIMEQCEMWSENS